MKTKASNEVLLEFPSRSSNESFARAAVACFAAQLDPTLNELEDIKTAVSEAVTNAIVHAYPDSIGKVQVKIRVCPGNVLEVTVKDHGRGIPDVDKARCRLLWKRFYDTIAIKERLNPKCRMTQMPQRYWKTMTEFQDEAYFKPRSSPAVCSAPGAPAVRSAPGTPPAPGLSVPGSSS